MTLKATVETIHSETGIPKKVIKAVIDKLHANIMFEVSNGREVKFIGFGKYLKAHRKARTGRNPATSKPMVIAACNTPQFKPSTTFKKALNI